jgi:hypothetical protein
VSPSEIALLAIGFVLGAGIGAASVRAYRAVAAPRQRVRVTVSRNSITPRRASTLSSADLGAGRDLIPGSPTDDGWLERRLAGAAGATDRVAQPDALPASNRTHVPSGPLTVSSAAVGFPVGRLATKTGIGDGRRFMLPGPGAEAVAGSIARAAVASAVLDPIAPLMTGERQEVAARPALRSTFDIGCAMAERSIRPRVPAPLARTILPSTVVAVHVGNGAPDDPAGGRPSVPSGRESTPGTERCESERRLLHERGLLADAAREQARLAADALREAQREYDILRDRVERAQVTADPREIRAAKDAVHRAFRAARASANTPDAAEAAARDWLNEINRLNTAAREASPVAESGVVELRAQLPRLDRLAVEADAARITAESAEAGRREAQEGLARCEESGALEAAAAARAQAAVPSAPGDAWPIEPEMPLRRMMEARRPEDDLAAVVRILHGDRPARERLVAALAGGDPETARQWHLRIAGLVDAIVARAIEDGYLDLPREGFWGLFTHREQREIVAALSALGFRFDGLGGFADGRVPAPRDLSLAVGYAGLDRMRIRIWPREAELVTIYAGASVAADEWLADEAGDLTLGRMVDALGARAAELADVWNAWGRVRPALLATD